MCWDGDITNMPNYFTDAIVFAAKFVRVLHERPLIPLIPFRGLENGPLSRIDDPCSFIE
jgi:hypothetical protein